MKDEDRIPEGYEIEPGKKASDLIRRHPEGQNQGDPHDPKSSDSIMFSAPHEGPPKLRMSMLRGRHELGHLTLTLEGAEGFLFRLAETIERVKERFNVNGGGLN